MAGELHKFRNFWTVDSGGWRAIFGAVIRYSIIGAAAAFAKSLVHQPDGKYSFDWPLFFYIFAAVAAANLLSNLLDVALRGGALFPYPRRGHALRAERKAWTAAVLRKIAVKLREAPISGADAREIVIDILNCIVVHVRDARGSHRHLEVFASLLMEDDDNLIVVARDRWLGSPQHQRPVPVTYPKGIMLGTRAMVSRRALSVGDLCREYPEAPKNKPYRSILAIPVIGTDETSVLAVVSVDSSRPYFFQSFRSGIVEDALENSLQPYLQTLVLALESLISPDKKTVLRELLAPTRLDDGGKANAGR